MPRRDPSKQRRGEFDLTQGGERQREKAKEKQRSFRLVLQREL